MKAPPSNFMGPSTMTPNILKDMENRGVIARSATQIPPSSEVYARPAEDEIIVFKDFFTAGLRFPLDPAVVDIFWCYEVFLHQMTPNSFVHLNLFMWLLRTC